jgi:oligoribonuclease (3'-5' exoribonuclease)
MQNDNHGVPPLFLSVDLEFTDGLDFHNARILQIGAAACDEWLHKMLGGFTTICPSSTTATVNQWVRGNLPDLLQKSQRRRQVVHAQERFGPELAAEYGYTTPFEQHRDYSMPAIMGRFREWALDLQAEHIKHHLHQRKVEAAEEGRTVEEVDPYSLEVPIVMVTYCGGYDFAFLARAFSGFGVRNPFHYEMVDISALAMGKLGLEWGYSSETLHELLGVAEMDDDKKHDALEDAVHQAALYRALMSYDLVAAPLATAWQTPDGPE